jgi:alpha-L-rhamnosidase
LIAANADNAIERLGAHLAPDFQIVASGPNGEAERQSARENVGFVHRRLQDGDLYFVSNISGVSRDLRVRFACGHKKPELWNPETRNIHKTLSFNYVKIADHDTTEVDLRLEPFESCFVVFRAVAERPIITRTNLPSLLDIRAVRVTGQVTANGEYFLTRSDDNTQRFTVTGVPDAFPLPGPWKLRLGGTVTLELQELQSWSDLREGKGYSGWAIYETSFDWKEWGDEIEWLLDLGQVHETAEAELNGIALGAAWKGARKLSCKGALKAAQNALRIEAANLWIHKVVNSPPWDRSAVAATYGARWGEPDIAVPPTLPPSGLLGPVQLLPRKRWTIKL